MRPAKRDALKNHITHVTEELRLSREDNRHLHEQNVMLLEMLKKYMEGRG